MTQLCEIINQFFHVLVSEMWLFNEETYDFKFVKCGYLAIENMTKGSGTWLFSDGPQILNTVEYG